MVQFSAKDHKLVKKLRPFVYVIFLQFGFAGYAIVAKMAMNQGTSHYTFSIYNNAIAAILFAPFALVMERNTRPRMTLSVFLRIMLLGLLDPVLGQNLFYAGMKYTTATVSSALCNLLPALTFLLAWILRIENVNLREIRSHAKIIGTLVTLGGALIMTLVTGSVIGLPWTHSHDIHPSTNPNDHPDPVKGAILISTGCLCYSMFYVLQSITLKSYPAGLSLTALICTLGALEGTAVTLVAERGNTEIWELGWNMKLLAYAYGGIVSTGITYYLSGVIMKEKGPVFVTAFNPFNMIIVAILSSFIFAERMNIGKLIGAVVIVIGLYLVIWGKSKEHKVEEIIQHHQKSPANPFSLPDAAKIEKIDDSNIVGENVTTGRIAIAIWASSTGDLREE